jgi:Cu-Zn family superoxide dismutase
MKYSTILTFVSSLAFAAAAPVESEPAPTFQPLRASVALNGEKIKGTVWLTQLKEGEPTLITYDITGLDPSAKRGFHVHESGNLTGGCAAAGGHYNPFGKEHGARVDTIRHVGDLGNIESDAKGHAKGEISDTLVQLFGPQSVIGRSIVVHGGTDDLGRGGTADSKKTGNAGPRPVCGTITPSTK